MHLHLRSTTDAAYGRYSFLAPADVGAGSGPSLPYADGDVGAKPFWLLDGNAAITDWAGQYYVAHGKRSYSNSWDHEHNMCGTTGWALAVGLLWGCFFLCLGLLGAWWAIRCWSGWSAGLRRSRRAGGGSHLHQVRIGLRVWRCGKGAQSGRRPPPDTL